MNCAGLRTRSTTTTSSGKRASRARAWRSRWSPSGASGRGRAPRASRRGGWRRWSTTTRRRGGPSPPRLRAATTNVASAAGRRAAADAGRSVGESRRSVRTASRESGARRAHGCTRGCARPVGERGDDDRRDGEGRDRDDDGREGGIGRDARAPYATYFFSRASAILHARHARPDRRRRRLPGVARPAGRRQHDGPRRAPQRAHRTTTRADGVGWGGIRPAGRPDARRGRPPLRPLLPPAPQLSDPVPKRNVHGGRPRVRLPRHRRRRRRLAAPDRRHRPRAHPRQAPRRAHARGDPARALHLELTVDDVPIAIFASKDPADATGVYVVRGNSGCAPRRAAPPTSPSSATPTARCSTSPARSPPTGAPRGPRRRPRRGRDGRRAPRRPRRAPHRQGGRRRRPRALRRPYVSESAIADAVGLLLAHPRPKARKGGGARAAPRLVETSAA